MNTTRRCGYFSLIAAGEPFRLLFPIGTLIGILGVLMWPLFVWNVTTTYPGIMHSRVMIEGFLTCFVVGFLGTALPRLLDVPRMSLAETLGFTVALAGVSGLHFHGHALAGDSLFVFTLAAFLFALVARAIYRKDTPPPAFVLVAMGMLSALTGAAVQTFAQIAPSIVHPVLFSTSRLFLNQGYLLLPIMGIGAFLLPRFFGLPNRQNFPESLALPPGWKRRALFAAGCGLAIWVSFLLEASGHPRIGCALRATAVLIYFIREVPVHQAGLGGGTLAMGLRIALFSIPIGYGFMALWPQHISSFLHIVFITGFSLLTFTVATRVALGHSGQSGKFRAPLPSVRLMLALVTLAMLTRVSADWLPAIRMSHYAYAAASWIIGVVIWAMFILPSVRKSDPEHAS